MNFAQWPKKIWYLQSVCREYGHIYDTWPKRIHTRDIFLSFIPAVEYLQYMGNSASDPKANSMHNYNWSTTIIECEQLV